MENQSIEVRSLQKYITSGLKNMTEQETRALDQTGSAVVIPTTVSDKLITDEKYSTLLNLATVFNDTNAGKLTIPVASSTKAVWKDELKSENATGETYEASPVLSEGITLGGHELYRWMRMSAAAYSLSASQFEQMMLNLLSSEVIETLEESFIKGTGQGQPLGLDNMTFTVGQNSVEATTSIEATNIAQAISLLPSKHARKAVIMCNTSTLGQISLLKGTAEYAYDLSSGASKFLNHEIIVNEHIDDDVIYVVDPSELYVRFAMPIQVEANRSSGFTSASIDLRALTVVDSAWNPKAVAKVSVGA